jgi:DNA polymerase III subunit delta
MTPSQAIDQAKKGKLLPVYLVAGEERVVRDEVVAALRVASLAGGLAAFNEDRFTAGEAGIDAVISAARTVPMMAARRFVLLRGAERLDGSTGGGRGQTADSPESDGAPFDRLAEYAAAPVESTCLVVVASKIDGRRKLVVAARKQGFLVACEPLDARALPGWIVDRCKAKGHAIADDVAELLAAVAGPQLSPVDDAIERLSLYVGEGAPIVDEAVRVCVSRVRTADTWALVDAVGARDLGSALRTLADAYDPREGGLMLLGALAWSVRQLARFQAAREAGASVDEAARRAGAYNTYRARELSTKARAIGKREVHRWMLVFAETDLALKSSRRTPDVILEEMLVALCRPGRAQTGDRPADAGR